MSRTCRKHGVKGIATYGDCPECLKEFAALKAKRDAEDTQRRDALWDAINRYTTACGGDPAQHIYGNSPRQTAVAEVERIVFDK